MRYLVVFWLFILSLQANDCKSALRQMGDEFYSAKYYQYHNEKSMAIFLYKKSISSSESAMQKCSEEPNFSIALFINYIDAAKKELLKVEQ